MGSFRVVGTVGRLVGGLVRGVSVKTTQLLGFVGIATLCGLLAAALVVPLVGALAYATNNGTKQVAQFPADLKIPSLDGRTYVYDASGGLIATFFSQNRVYVPLAKIAPVMRQAIVDIEDERFYEHGAADLKGTLRALANNAQSGSTQGGSTLTQQYVKNILINDATTPAELQTVLYDRHIPEKLRELRYAIALEQKLTKAQILEGYLNIAPFGRSVYGVEAASEYYFDTTAAKLTPAQAAMLAGEVQAPSLYDPTAGGNHPVQATNRRNIVLAKMRQLHHLSAAAYRTAVASPLGIHKTVPKQSCYAANVSQWYCDYILKTLENDPQFAVLGSSTAARLTRINSGGLKIYTAVDPKVQQLADAGMAAKTDPTDNTIVSTAIVQPGTGNILAISNSKGYGTDAKAGQTLNDYAVPYAYGNSVGFQPGSGMKPITMAVALEEGVPLSYRITAVDGPTLGQLGLSYTNCKGENVTDPTYPLTNEGGQSYGSISMLQGIWESVNSYFVQLEAKVGLCPVARLAAKMGVTTVRLSGGTRATALLQVPTLTLGTNNTSPLQMSEVYATLSNHGVYCAPRVVTRIVDVDAKRTLYDAAPACSRVMPADVADAISWALYHNVEGDLDPASTANPQRLAGVPLAGKTGTTDRHNAVWYNAYNPQFAASLMVARPSILETVDDQVVGGVNVGSSTGGRTAGAIWSAVMDPILLAQKTHPGFIDRPADKFDAASGVLGAKAAVPDVVGSDLATAELELVRAQFSYTVSSQPIDSTVPAGLVAATSPDGGAQTAMGTSVTIYLSTGNAPTPSPSPSPSATAAPSPSPSAAPTAGPTQPPSAAPTTGATATAAPSRAATATAAAGSTG